MKINSSPFLLIFIFIFILISASNAFPQELDITPYLQRIEAGDKNEVAEKLPELKRLNPSSPSLIYLEGLLTEDGEKSFQIYKSLVDKYPNSKYADDAIYRIYAYFAAVDKIDKADFYLNRLKTEYPQSPYIGLTKRVTFTETTKPTVKTNESKTIPNVKEKIADKEYKFTIQAGAFTRKENALKLKADFDKAGYSSQVIEKSVGGSVFHVVNVGKFFSEEEAKSFLTIINSKFKLQGWVVRLE
jgi:tetratricopeptide (TPR) repeat protein